MSGALFVPVLARLTPEQVEQLQALARETRIRQADYLREAVADLLRKYGADQPPGVEVA